MYVSLSVVPRPVFVISGLSLRVEDAEVFFLQYKVLSVRNIHYPVNPSSEHFLSDAVVPSGNDNCSIETVLPASDHYRMAGFSSAIMVIIASRRQ